MPARRQIFPPCAPGRQLLPALMVGVLALGLAGAATAQPAVFPRQPHHLALQVWKHGPGAGLPQNNISAVLQTQDRYVFLGTQEGLVRFDGRQFTSYRRQQHALLGSNFVRRLAEAADHVLWVGTEKGVAFFDGARFLAQPTGLPAAEVSALLPERGSSGWVGTSEGLYRLDHGRATAYPALRGTPIYSLARDARGHVWVGTDAEVVRLDGASVVRYGADQGVAGNVRALVIGPNGQLWAGTRAGIARFAGDRFVPYTRGDAAGCTNVTSIALERDGTLWAGTREGGVYHIGANGLSAIGRADGLPHNTIRSLATDHEGGLWVGTDGGLARLQDGPFRTLTSRDGLGVDGVLTVLEGRDGTLWIGTDGGGLTRRRGTESHTFTVAEGLPAGLVVSLLETKAGDLYAGLIDAGLCRLRRGEAHFQCLTTADGLISNNVFATFEGADGTLWIGTESGLNRLRGGRIETVDAVPDQSVTAMLEAGGALWVGTYGDGLVRIAGTQTTSFGAAEGLGDGNVLTLLHDADGTLWAGLLGDGLCRLRPGEKRFRCYGTDEGLFDDNVLQLLDDGRGSFWLGSNRGIVRMSRSSFDALDAGRTQRIGYEPVGTSASSGLRTPEVNGGVQPAAWRGRGGRLYFGTMGGLAVLDPVAYDRFRRLPVPPVLVEGAETPGGQLLGSGARLRPSERDVTFHFTALSFVSPDDVRLRYRLLGYDRRWHELVGEQRAASYTNLPPGHFAFRVEAAGLDGRWHPVRAPFAVEMRPHLYETRWFAALCLLLALGAALGLYRARVRSLTRRQEELEGIVTERTTELRAREHDLEMVNAGLEAEVHRQFQQHLGERRHYEDELITARDKAEESARLKQNILNNMSHEIRTPLSAILGVAELLALDAPPELQEFVHYIDENGKRLLTTLNGVLDLSRIESEGVELRLEAADAAGIVAGTAHLLEPLAARKGVGLRVEAPGTLAVCVDIFALECIATNLVSNAIKFTDAGGVTVTVEAEGDALLVRVADTGVGIDASFLPHLFEPFKQESAGLSRTHEGSGLGLALVQRYVTAMGGEIDVKSAKGAGSVFTVRLPGLVTASVAAPRALLQAA